MQPRPTDAARGFLSCQWSDALVACKVIGTTTSMWPDAAEMTGRLRRPPTRDQRRQEVEANRDRRARLRKSRMDARRVKLGTHMWAKVGSSTLRCVACLAWHRWDMEVCPGLPPSWSKWLQNAKLLGHSIRHAVLHEEGCGEAVPMVICARCGSYSTGARAVGLSEDCKPRTQAGQTALERVATGRHPKQGRSPRWCSLYSHRACV